MDDKVLTYLIDAVSGALFLGIANTVLLIYLVLKKILEGK